ncbi:MAG TPA: helix-turn-helix domain-containing protein [Thermodesulfobacteriota bacterium]|nr:helix-turn-helix domain-containing protein [Thermodesulfobacteriota bacterium]
MAEKIWPAYLTFGEAFLYSRIPRRTLRSLLASGEIPSRKFPGKVVIAKEAIDRYMAEETTLPDSLLRRTGRRE